MKPEDIKLGIEINGEPETLFRLSKMINKMQDDDSKNNLKIAELSSQVFCLSVENRILKKNKGFLNDDPFVLASNLFDIEYDKINSKSQKKLVIYARSVLYNHFKKTTPYSLSKIGKMLGGKDHATVLHGINAYNNLYETDKWFKFKADEFNEKVR